MERKRLSKGKGKGSGLAAKIAEHREKHGADGWAILPGAGKTMFGKGTAKGSGGDAKSKSKSKSIGTGRSMPRPNKTSKKVSRRDR